MIAFVFTVWLPLCVIIHLSNFYPCVNYFRFEALSGFVGWRCPSWSACDSLSLASSPVPVLLFPMTEAGAGVEIKSPAFALTVPDNRFKVCCPRRGGEETWFPCPRPYRPGQSLYLIPKSQIKKPEVVEAGEAMDGF